MKVKVAIKTVAEDILRYFSFHCSEKMRLVIMCELSA